MNKRSVNTSPSALCASHQSPSVCPASLARSLWIHSPSRSPCRLDTPCPKFSHRRQIGPQQQWMLERIMIERRFDFQAFQLAVSDPVLLDVAQSEKAQFFGGLIIGEMAAVFDDFAQLHMQAFNRVG